MIYINCDIVSNLCLANKILHQIKYHLIINIVYIMMISKVFIDLHFIDINIPKSSVIIDNMMEQLYPYFMARFVKF